MSDKPSGNTDKRSVTDTCATDAKHFLIYAAGQRNWTDTRASWLARAARRLGINYRRARGIFYGEHVRLGADEYAAICRRVADLEKTISQQKANENELSVALARARAVAGVGVVPGGGETSDEPGGGLLLRGEVRSAGPAKPE